MRLMLFAESKAVPCLFAFLAALLLTGCSSSTIQSRKKERATAYAGFSADTKTMVEQGQIKVGMPMDAVYISWGQPAEVLQSENAAGKATTWIYYGGYMEETRYWARRRMETDYQPRTYVRAEVIFINGLVHEWRTLPQPAY
ncbi:MAG TPA: hypothetical protein VLT36_11305 [Candidatus Dormibacteraeota bacterium]|nr:hypothetical protein [Candidatus Dormibacteraeota bacterium]